MTHRVRSAFGRFLAGGFAAAVTLSLATASLVAQQVTGKIEGTVTDQAGAPIANAQVLIVGTSFGAITSDKGYYFMNNVPVGTHTVRAQFIGYTPAEVRGVRVLGGQTITTDIKMESSAVQVGTITVTAAANPIVPRDQVSSKFIVGGDNVGSLPVDDVRNVVSLSPGVVESGSSMGVSIRGGRPGEANVYIDGAPVRQAQSGAQGITIGTNALEEASVTTGALGVEFSDAQSGVISFTTKAGGDKLAGSASYESDEPFGDAISVGYNRMEGSIGGPVPKIANLTWFTSGVLSGQQSRFRGAGFENVPYYVLGGVDQVVTDTVAGVVSASVLPQYVQYSGQCGETGSSASAMAQAIQNNYGFECQGRRRPMDWTSFIQLQGKLQYSYGSGSSVALTGLATGNQSRNFPGRTIGDPALYSGRHDYSRLAVLNWNHQVSRSAERALSINLNLSYGRDRSITGPLDPSSEIDSRSPGMGIYFGTLDFSGYGGFPFPIADQTVRNVRTNTGLRLPLLDRTDLDNAQNGRLNPYGMQSGGWVTSGFSAAGQLLSESRYNARLVADWQANRFHRFTLGGDAKKTNLAYWSSNFLRQAFMDAYVVKPEQYGVFGSDRLDLGDVVLELGVRYDYYNSNTLFPRTPGRIFTHPDFASNYSNAGTDDAQYAAFLADTSIWTPSVGHSTISPRLRVSFPVTEQTGFRLSYAHQVQTPDFSTLGSGINNDISFTNSNDTFGQDVTFGKSILFEFGVRHAFSQDVVLDVSAYNKDKVSDIAYRILPFIDPRNPTDTSSLNVLTNLDFGNSRGVDVKFDWRIGSYLNTTVAYTFQVAKGTGSDPSTYLNTFARQVSGLTGDRTLPPEQAQRTDNDRTHNLVGNVSLTLPGDWKAGTTLGTIGRNVSMFATFRAVSGLPYTPLQNNADGQTVPFLAFGLGGRTLPGATLNGAVLPWTKNIDLRVNKGFRLGRVDMTAYADVRNLFNWKNIVGLFAETGDVVNADHRQQTLDSEFTGLVNEASAAGAIVSGTSADIDLTLSCSNWSSRLNCESLRRVEARFGNGDGIYSLSEQQTALGAFYTSFFGPAQFYGQPRHIRLGFELSF